MLHVDVWISEVINQLLIGILEEGGQGQSVVSDPNKLRTICHDDLSKSPCMSTFFSDYYKLQTTKCFAH